MKPKELGVILDKAANHRTQRPLMLWCSVSEAQLETGNGRTIAGTIASCPRCGHETESYGTSDRSVRRCLALLREECPEGEANIYADADQAPSSRSPVDVRISQALDRIYGT